MSLARRGAHDAPSRRNATKFESDVSVLRRPERLRAGPYRHVRHPLLVRDRDDRRRGDRSIACGRPQQGVPVQAVRDDPGARRALNPAANRAPGIPGALRRRR
jgi:hypothetical protein